MGQLPEFLNGMFAIANAWDADQAAVSGKGMAWDRKPYYYYECDEQFVICI